MPASPVEGAEVTDPAAAPEVEGAKVTDPVAAPEVEAVEGVVPGAVVKPVGVGGGVGVGGVGATVEWLTVVAGLTLVAEATGVDAGWRWRRRTMIVVLASRIRREVKTISTARV